MREVLETTKKVVERARLVAIDAAALTRFAETLRAGTFAVPPWETFCHYQGTEKDVVAYVLVLDTINFCFWPKEEGQRWEFNDRSGSLSGYWGLAAALTRAMETGVPLAEARFLAGMTLHDLQAILAGKGALQLLEARVHNLNELGRVLRDEFDGHAFRLVEAAHGSAPALARLLARRLSSFRDAALYDGAVVYFYKRAQIVAADLYGAFQGTGWGGFDDIDRLTAFADYKLPQVLRHLGILVYAPALARTVDRGVLLAPGSPEEVEIRAHTIWAVEMIRARLREGGKDLPAHAIDWVLWNMGQQENYRARPYHRTTTIFY